MRKAAAGLCVVSVVALAWACGTQTPNGGGSGDDFTDDTRDAALRPPASPPGPDLDATEEFLYTDLDAGPDVTVTLQLGACDTCHCSPESSYCFGGAVERAAIQSEAPSDAGEGDDALCPVLDASPDGASNPGLSPIIGCNELPKGCTTCACIIAELQPQYACYLVCANDGRQMLVYCPSP